MIRTLAVRNRQRTRAVNAPLLRRIARWAVEDQFHEAEFELGIHLVGSEEMASVNETFLSHEGSTDVITFDHRDDGQAGLHGEIFISLDDAVRQARQFRTTWQSELARYLLHGLLHLQGYDDLPPAARGKMKREENRLVRLAMKKFRLSELARQ